LLFHYQATTDARSCEGLIM